MNQESMKGKSYNLRKKMLLMSCYMIEMESMLKEMKRAADNCQYKKAARIGMMISSEAKQLVKIRGEIKEMKREQMKLKKSKKLNPYAGGYFSS